MSRPANWSDWAQSDHLSDQVRAKVMCCKPLTTLSPDQWLLNHQSSVLAPYRSPPTANRSPHWGGVLPLCRCAVGVFYSPSRQGNVDFEAMLQTTEVNVESSTKRISDQWGSSPSWPWQKHQEQLNCVSRYLSIAKLLSRLSSKRDWALLPWNGNQSRMNTEFKPGKLCLKINLVLHPDCGEGVG